MLGFYTCTLDFGSVGVASAGRLLLRQLWNGNYALATGKHGTETMLRSKPQLQALAAELFLFWLLSCVCLAVVAEAKTVLAAKP